jgi:hypothetical protein
MTILQVEDKPVESGLLQRLQRIPASQREVVTGSLRPVFGRQIFAFDVAPPRATGLEQRPRLSGSLTS